MKLSIVIPFFNEEGNIEPVIREAVEVLSAIPCEYEILAFDDGSGDQTPTILKRLSHQVKGLKVFTHPRNFGQGVCLWEGLSQAVGEVVVTMDGDGQNDFHDVQRMLPLLDRFDAILGQRIRRSDPLPKRVGTRIAFFFRRHVLGDTVRDTGCGLKIMRRKVIQYFIPFRSFHLFIPFMLAQAGVSFTTINVNHRPRKEGRSKYSFRKLYFLPSTFDLFFMWRFKRINLYKFGSPKN